MLLYSSEFLFPQKSLPAHTTAPAPDHRAHRTPAAPSQTFIGLTRDSVQKHLRLLVVFDQYRNEMAQRWLL